MTQKAASFEWILEKTALQQVQDALLADMPLGSSEQADITVFQVSVAGKDAFCSFSQAFMLLQT